LIESFDLIGILLLRFLHLGTAADMFGLPAAPDPYHAAYNCGSGTPRTLNLSSFSILIGKLWQFDFFLISLLDDDSS
jgi:hypothetical protein